MRLSADAESEKYLASGICTDGSLTVSGSDVTVEGRDCGVELGFPASSVFSLDGGKLTAISQEGAGVGASGRGTYAPRGAGGDPRPERTHSHRICGDRERLFLHHNQ